MEGLTFVVVLFLVTFLLLLFPLMVGESFSGGGGDEMNSATCANDTNARWGKTSRW